MNSVRIKLAILGEYPVSIDLRKIKKFRSKIFSIIGEIDHIAMRQESDLDSWSYSDEKFEKIVPERSNADIVIAITNVPLECNWYSRRLQGCRIIFTLYEIRDILSDKNIPIENAVLRIIYSYSLVYLSFKKNIPRYDSDQPFTHDETRGCLFDMNGMKEDIVYSCDQPKICDECRERLATRLVPKRIIEDAAKDIKKIKKDAFYKISDFVKNRPFVSMSFVFLSSVMASLIASFLHGFAVQILSHINLIQH